MSIKSIIRKIALQIISQPKNKVSVEVSSISYGGILNKQCIVVTGGSKGIGYSMVKKFVAEGASVIITGRNIEDLKKATEALGPSARFIQFDNSDISGIENFIKDCGHIDSLVLNAGVSFHEGNILNVTEEGYDKQFDINLKANYFLAKAFLKSKLAKNEGGNLLFLSSETAGKCIDIPYGLTKTAINSLVGGLARRVYEKGIRVNAIAPGVTYTDMTKGANVITNDYANNSVAGRFLLPEEIAEVACFIISNASKCITGEIIYCDAGSHLKINGTESEYSF